MADGKNVRLACQLPIFQHVKDGLIQFDMLRRVKGSMLLLQKNKCSAIMQ